MLNDDAGQTIDQALASRVAAHACGHLATIGERPVRAMRISISNWSTTAEEIDRSAAAILSALEGAAAPSL